MIHDQLQLSRNVVVVWGYSEELPKGMGLWQVAWYLDKDCNNVIVIPESTPVGHFLVSSVLPLCSVSNTTQMHKSAEQHVPVSKHCTHTYATRQKVKKSAKKWLT